MISALIHCVRSEQNLLFEFMTGILHNIISTRVFSISRYHFSSIVLFVLIKQSTNLKLSRSIKEKLNTHTTIIERKPKTINNYTNEKERYNDFPCFTNYPLQLYAKRTPALVGVWGAPRAAATNNSFGANPSDESPARVLPLSSSSTSTLAEILIATTSVL